MSRGHWQISNRPASATQATASITGPSTPEAIRLTSFSASVGGTGANTNGQLVIRDGATGTGTILYTEDVLSLANTSTNIARPNLDLRATSGTLTIEFVAAGAANTQQAVNAQGDFIQAGYPHGGP